MHIIQRKMSFLHSRILMLRSICREGFLMKLYSDFIWIVDMSFKAFIKCLYRTWSVRSCLCLLLILLLLQFEWRSICVIIFWLPNVFLWQSICVLVFWLPNFFYVLLGFVCVCVRKSFNNYTVPWFKKKNSLKFVHPNIHYVAVYYTV